MHNEGVGSRTTLAAWAITVAAGLLGVAGLVFRFVNRPIPDISPTPLAGGLLVVAVGVAVLGTLIVRRQPSNTIGWAFLTVGLGLSVGGVSEPYAALATEPGRSLPFASVANAIQVHGGIILMWLPVFALLLLFPDGKPPPGRWRYLVPITAAWGAVIVGVSITEATGVVAMETVATIGDVAWMGQMLLFPLAAGALVARYRRAVGLQRQQLRWLLASVGVTAVGGIVSLLLAVIDPAGNGIVDAIPVVLIGAGLASVPISATIAITRYRLFELDRIVNRAAAYTLLVVLLTATYTISVLLLRAVIPMGESSDVAVAGSTLAVAGLFGPLRRRLREMVDLRFHRAQYDARMAVEHLGRRLRDEVDLATLTAAVVEAVSTTVAPTHVSLWNVVDLADGRVSGDRSPRHHRATSSDRT